MAKDYFSHDYNARNDTKLTKLFMKYKLSGLGAYWCVVEMIYEEGGYLLRSEYERISFELRCEYDFIKSVIEDFDLFDFDDEKFWSETALERLKLRAERSQKARESIEKRWNKYKGNTNVKQPKNDSNTRKVKESKGKESKVNKIKYAEFVSFTKDEYEKLISDYGKTNVDKFISTLDNYKGSNGKKYKSDYRAILSWVIEKVGCVKKDSTQTRLSKWQCKAKLADTKVYECETEEEAKDKYKFFCGSYPDTIIKVN